MEQLPTKWKSCLKGLSSGAGAALTRLMGFGFLGARQPGGILRLFIQQMARGVIRPVTGWKMLPHERNLYDRQVK